MVNSHCLELSNTLDTDVYELLYSRHIQTIRIHNHLKDHLTVCLLRINRIRQEFYNSSEQDNQV